MSPVIYRLLAALLVFLGAASMGMCARAVAQLADPLYRFLGDALVVFAALLATASAVTAMLISIERANLRVRRP
jgi:hypothetical protein